MTGPIGPLHVQQPFASTDSVGIMDGNRVVFTLSRYRNVAGKTGAYIFRSDRVGPSSVIWEGGSEFYYNCSVFMGPDGYGYVQGTRIGSASGSAGGTVNTVPIPTFLPWAQPMVYAQAPVTISGPQGLQGGPGGKGDKGDKGDTVVGPMPSDDHIAEIAWGKATEAVKQFWNYGMDYLPGHQEIRNFVWDYAIRAMKKAGVPNLPAVNGEDTWKIP